MNTPTKYSRTGQSSVLLYFDSQLMYLNPAMILPCDTGFPETSEASFEGSRLRLPVQIRSLRPAKTAGAQQVPVAFFVI